MLEIGATLKILLIIGGNYTTLDAILSSIITFLEDR